MTLDHLSGGRLVLGVGLGGSPQADFEAFGDEADPRRRGEMLDESLEVVAGLWTGEDYNFAGRHYRIGPTRLAPPPRQHPRIPVWVAGVWPNRKPFRRAARWDGAVPDTKDQDGVTMPMAPTRLPRCGSSLRPSAAGT